MFNMVGIVRGQEMTSGEKLTVPCRSNYLVGVKFPRAEKIPQRNFYTETIFSPCGVAVLAFKFQSPRKKRNF